MAKRKSRPAKAPHGHPAPTPPKSGTRRFLNRGVQVEITEARGHVGLTLDGVPIEVAVVDGQFFSHLAHMFTGFGSMDALVDTLLANQGRTWSLHGHVCDASCPTDGTHHDHGSGHDHGGGHDHGDGHSHEEGHDHGAAPRSATKRRGGRR
jgi:hypothetical protein